MHVQLGTPERQTVCAEFITALHKCHDRGAWTRFLGTCNEQKEALNLCLRKERIERTTRNRNESQERNRKKKEAWEALEADIAASETKQ